MCKRIEVVYNSFITDIDLNAQLTFVFLCGCNAMSHISESAVPKTEGGRYIPIVICCGK